MTKLTALAALPLIATVVALLAFTSDTQADFLGDCPPVFTTQDVCYINVANVHDIAFGNDHLYVNAFGVVSEPDGDDVRILNVSDHGQAIAIYPADGCSSFTSTSAVHVAVMNGTNSPQACFAPLRFKVGVMDQGVLTNVTNYCIQDNDAHTWQLCSTPDDMTTTASTQTETQQPPAPVVNASDWQRNCGSRSPGVYGTTANPLLCWADYVGGNLGGDTDPWGTNAWVTFTDCEPVGCRTYNN